MLIDSLEDDADHSNGIENRLIIRLAVDVSIPLPAGKIKFSTFFNFQYNTVSYFVYVFCIFRCIFCKAYIFMVSLKCCIEY
jgi:hypothetical protein